MSLSKKLVWNPRSWRFIPIFFPEDFYSFMFRTLIHFELIFVYVGVKGPSSFFSVCYSHTKGYWKDFSFSQHWMALAAYQNSTDHRCLGLFLGSLLYSIGPCTSKAHHLDYYCYIVSLEIGIYKSYYFVLFQYCFGYSSPVQLHMKFKISLSISTNKSADILLGIIFNL